MLHTCTLTYMHTQPVVVVHQGKEPEQLLHLFMGKFVVHRPSFSSSPSTSSLSTTSLLSSSPKLYCVSGSSTCRCKAEEVLPCADKEINGL